MKKLAKGFTLCERTMEGGVKLSTPQKT